MIIYACNAFDFVNERFVPAHLSACVSRGAAWLAHDSTWQLMTIRSKESMYLLDEVIGFAPDEGDAVRWVAEGEVTP